MIRATASAAVPRPAALSASAPRRAPLVLLLTTVLTLAGTASVAQHAAAAERSGDDVWVNVDGVAFERGWESDEVAYVVRPAGRNGGGQAYSRDLTREERYRGWTAFGEARQAYPDGYCVVWVEVEDAGSWHESRDNTACTAVEPTGGTTPTATPTPTPTPAVVNDEEAAETAPQEPDQDQDRPASAPVAPAPTTQAPQAKAAPSATPTPTPTPSSTPSPTASSTPSPTPSHSASETPLLQPGWEQPPARTVMDAAGEQDEVISPLGWVAVLGSGGVLTAGGLLMLWRRLT